MLVNKFFSFVFLKKLRYFFILLKDNLFWVIKNFMLLIIWFLLLNIFNFVCLFIKCFLFCFDNVNKNGKVCIIDGSFDSKVIK